APPSPQQVVLAEVHMGSPLEPGECITRTLTLGAVLPPAATGEGAFYLGALIDTEQSVAEVDELNNGFVRGLMGVGDLADLVVSELKAPASARSGEYFPVELRVCNAGSTYVSGSNVALFISTQDTLSVPAPGSPPSPTQRQVGDVYVPSMEPGVCLTLQGEASAQHPNAATPGQPLYFGAIVDPEGFREELREDNNVRVAGVLSIGNQADLVVTDVTGVDNLFPYGWVNASVRVCNVGTDWTSSVGVDLLLSTLPTLSGPFNPGSMTESVIGSAQTWGLEAGQCSTLWVQGSVYVPPAALPDAPLYVGARVDGTMNVPELREDNNTFVKGLIGVGHGPDLVIRSLTAPDDAMPSGSFTAEAKVCNVGTESSHSARLELFLSTEDAVVLPAPNGPIYSRTQVPVGSVEVNNLYPGDCVLRRVEASVQLPYEAYGSMNPNPPLTLGAIVDPQRITPELREDNNVFTLGKLGVGYGPDLILRDLKVPANLRQGQSFTATYTVCNAGNDNVPGFGISLYLSTHATAPEPRPVYYPSYSNPAPGYHLLGRVDSSPFLHAGQCIAQRATFYASGAPIPPEQPVYLSAVVDTTYSELRRDNNSFAAGRVGLGSARSDLAITEINAPASARQGYPFTTSMRVCNLGTEMSNSTFVEVYLSSEPSLFVPAPYAPSGPPPSSQMPVNTVSVPSLGVGACITREVTGTASRPYSSNPQQPVYVGAQVNPWHWSSQQELRRDNNVLMAGRISLGSGPDLIITAMDAPPSFEPNAPFYVSARVCNVGNDASSSTNVTFLLAQDDQWSSPPAWGPPPYSSNQQEFATLPVPQLEPGRCATPSEEVSAYGWWGWQDQPVYVGATVDRTQNLMELREDNNVFVLGRIGVGHGPDLVVTDVTGPTNAQPGQSFTANVTVCNQGTQDAFNASRVDLYVLGVPQLSMPAQYGPSYPEPVAWTSVDPLEAGACISLPVEGGLNVYGNLETQTFHLGAAVDAFRSVQELREDNNTFVGARIGVGYRPDLVITALGGPASVMSSGTLRAPITVCNQGTAPSQSQSVEVVLSTESVLPEPVPPPDGMEFFPTRSRLGMMQVPSLQPDACTTVDEPLSVILPTAALPESPLFLGALLPVSSYLDQELRTDNNTFVRGRIGVGNEPDLVITQVTAPFSVRNNALFTTTVKVCNQGTATAGTNAGQLELFLSTTSTLEFPQDVTMGSTQVSLGSLNLGTLQPQQCTTRQLSTRAIPPPGSPVSGMFYLGAIVDSQRSVTELREDNNTFAQGFLAVMP
ncbi:CARDB domain-containing protein, partial [Corallococcus terminator]|uniref:CARDB domain-containing protein n=1 Tax=Corallococcus terminator TaxID=2316733 RepID=UPI001ABFDB97